MAKNKSYDTPQAQSITEVIESFPFANLIDEDI